MSSPASSIRLELGKASSCVLIKMFQILKFLLNYSLITVRTAEIQSAILQFVTAVLGLLAEWTTCCERICVSYASFFASLLRSRRRLFLASTRAEQRARACKPACA